MVLWKHDLDHEGYRKISIAGLLLRKKAISQESIYHSKPKAFNHTMHSLKKKVQSQFRFLGCACKLVPYELNNSSLSILSLLLRNAKIQKTAELDNESEDKSNLPCYSITKLKHIFTTT